MKRKHVVYLAVLFLYLIFYDLIIHWFDEKIVDKILSGVRQTTRLHFSIFILSILTTTYFGWLFYKSKPISDALLGALLILGSTYAFYRFESDKYKLLSSYYFGNVKYADFILLVTVGYILVWIRAKLDKFHEPHYFTKPFLLDSPITNEKQDQLNRTKFAKNLAEKIQSKPTIKNSGALAIGINGKWGSGKTSFIKLVECHIKPENRILIHFNPWLSNSSQSIIEDFFEQMASELKDYDVSLSKDIQGYAQTLVTIDSNIVSNSVKALSDLITGAESKQEYYEKINTSIRKSKKQIIIFIDDLDRLDNKEIIEVLRIVRNTANFDNLVYVISYDKQYVVEALHHFNEYGASTFLEKIFQFEFDLPRFKWDSLRNFLKHRLEKEFDQKVEGYLIEAAVNTEGDSGNITHKVIRTPRDVARFVNSMSTDLDMIWGEVNFVDFYLIQLLKLKYYEVYKYITEHQTIFFRKKRDRVVRREGTTAREASIDDQIHDTVNDNEDDKGPFYINEWLKKQNLEDLKNTIIKDIINQLLKPKTLNGNEEWRPTIDYMMGLKETRSLDYRSFAFWGSHENYFTLNLLASDFSSGQFYEARKGTTEVYITQIDSFIGQGFLWEIEDRLKLIKDFETKDEWEKDLIAWFHILYYVAYNRNKHLEITKKEVIETICYPNKNGLINSFFDNDNKKYTKFVKDLFDKAKSPFLVEGQLLHGVLSVTFRDFPLERDEIYQLLFKYFKSYCDANKRFDEISFLLYNYAIVTYEDDHHPLENRLEVETYFSEHVKKHMTSNELDFFVGYNQQTSQTGDKFKYGLYEDRIKMIFENTDNLLDYIKQTSTIKHDEIYEEFISFLERLNTSSIKDKPLKIVDFDFKFLNPDRWVG